MRLPPQAKSYWLLFNTLLFPMPWLKWCMIAGAIMLMIGILTGWTLNNPVYAVVGMIILMMNFCMSYLSLPSEILSINSSKQFGLLPNLKTQSILILFVFCLFFSVCISFSVSFNRLYSPVKVFPVVYLMVSISMMGMLLIASSWPFMQGIIFIFVWTVFPIFARLMAVNVILISAALVVSWCLFVYWWYTWRPVRFHKSFFTSAARDVMEMQEEQPLVGSAIAFKFALGKPKTLLGTLLLSKADGWKNQLIQGAVDALIILLAIGFMNLLLSPNALQDMMSGLGGGFFLGLILGIGMALQTKIYTNLHKTWLLYSFSRRDLFFAAEATFFSAYVCNLLPCVLVLFGLDFLFSASPLGVVYVIALTVLGFLSTAVNYYVGMLVYIKIKEKNWFAFANVGGMFLSILTTIFLWNMAPESVMNWFLVLVSGYGVAAYGLRSWAIPLWPTADLVRVKS